MAKLDRKLRKVFKKITPDNLDSILSDLGQQKGDGVQVQKMEKNFGWKNVTAIAASAVLIVGISIAGIKLIGSGSHATPGTEPNLETVMPTQTVTPTETVTPTLPEGVNLTEDEARITAMKYSSGAILSHIEYKSMVRLVNVAELNHNFPLGIRWVYMVTLEYDGYAFTYFISAESGEILSESIRRVDSDIALHWKTARDIALRDAQVEMRFLTYFKIELDSQDELKSYKFSFRKSPCQYEYTVDAYTGEILNSKKEEVGYEADELLQKEANLRNMAILLATGEAGLGVNQLVYFDAEPVYNGDSIESYYVRIRREGEFVKEYSKKLIGYDDNSASWEE